MFAFVSSALTKKQTKSCTIRLWKYRIKRFIMMSQFKNAVFAEILHFMFFGHGFVISLTNCDNKMKANIINLKKRRTKNGRIDP